jgi:RNA polymerase sigma-70 factor, ECF subfamily
LIADSSRELGRISDRFFGGGHPPRVLTTSVLPAAPSELRSAEPSRLMAEHAFPEGRARESRFRELVGRHFEFVWRSVRRLGVRAADCDDAAQEVFLVAARRLDDFTLERERAFLFGTCARVASTRRRGARRRPEELDAAPDERARDELDPEELAELARARPLLQEILNGMSTDYRTVFILAEIEELSVREIAHLLDVPPGTVSSRLRVAREHFSDGVKRLQARAAFAWRKR